MKKDKFIEMSLDTVGKILKIVKELDELLGEVTEEGQL